MSIEIAPIRERVADQSGLFTQIWTLWLQKLVAALNTPVVTADIEIVGSDNGLILESPDGTRWRVQVTDAGNLTTTSL